MEKDNKYKMICDRLYRWLNDMRYAIAPDETVTDEDERHDRLLQIDLIDELMEWMIEQEVSNEKITIQAALNNLYIVKAVFKNIKADPELINSLNVAINSLEAWDDILDELGNINMDIYTDEVRHMIIEKMEVLDAN